MILNVRERPPLRTHVEAVTPSGRYYRWAEDEPKAANVVNQLRHSSTMPVGYESLDCVLAREPSVQYDDLERLTTLRVVGAGGAIAGEYRLERTPQVSGDQMAVNPSAVGWQAHLEDDKSAAMIYVDRDLSHWHEPSASRQANIGAVRGLYDASVVGDQSAGNPSILCRISGSWDKQPRSELHYAAPPGVKVERVYHNVLLGTGVNTGSSVQVFMEVGDRDDFNGVNETSPELKLTRGDYFVPNVPQRFLLAGYEWLITPAGVDGEDYDVWFRSVAVYGDHEVQRSGPDPAGFLASNVVAHAVHKWAPLLTFTPGETILPSTFVIPHLAFIDQTTAGEIVRQATRFGLQDWAVWDARTFYWHERGAFGKSWRARIGPAQLEDTGPQIDRLWNSLVVQYRDVDGSTRTVGPPGSGMDAESSLLVDDDPENPATLLNINRREMLQIEVSTAAAAIEIGRRFMEETKQADRSGRARLVGYVTDDRGVVYPYWAVRAGDTISFVDAADTSPRRIVRADHDRATRTCSVDLDAPPESLTATLERLGAKLVTLGL